jgi:hypothetical protein
VPSQVLTEDARMLRFLTPTEAWKGRVARSISLPGEWPVMLVEIFHREDGQISMTCALGVPKSSLKAFLAQGAYLYEFQELPGPKTMRNESRLRAQGLRTTTPRAGVAEIADEWIAGRFMGTPHRRGQ